MHNFKFSKTCFDLCVHLKRTCILQLLGEFCHKYHQLKLDNAIIYSIIYLLSIIANAIIIAIIMLLLCYNAILLFV